MKKRILFVDDEPNVLEGLQRMLRPLREEWDTAFAPSGPAALEMLEANPFDVVVTDMRMPGMDGAELLSEVMRRYPDIVRIVLSGHAERETVMRAVGPTHQYLAKPCDAETLKGTITRACALRELLASRALKGVVSRVTSLPSLPELYLAIVEELKNPEASIQRVGEIISRDIGMSARILHLVNSAFFGLRRHVSNPAQATSLLGLDTIKALVLSMQLFSSFQNVRCTKLNLAALWDHSIATGALAKRIGKDQSSDVKEADHAFMAGLLHDAGELVLAANLPTHYETAFTTARERHIPFWEAERATLGTTHAEVGAYLLGLWGLPDPIVEAIAYHHDPDAGPASGSVPLTAVHVADALEHELHNGELAGTARLKTDYLERLGLVDKLDGWRQTARALVQAGEGQ